ncbi:acetylglutamate kinase [Bacillus sp. V3B]|uniref:acetylglutamate kinase n=1 Tax=Bacillus sp. V3B TaxID=2804915 RepID=UPI00210B7886|nr:acetylglutamate kinase [Bacillus sp. V3B]MCQ6274329.1 acetylglutamate kinase [Bacillus sp. V3B]
MKKIVIKCGGSILDELTSDFFSSLKHLQEHGYQLIFVHGGGPDINKMLSMYQVEPEFYNGLRKTTDKTLEVVELVLSGQTNRKLVQKLTENGFQTIGLNGSDGGCLQADFIDQESLGFVGEITEVNDRLITILLQEGLIPVVTPIAVNKSGQKLNINADYAAAAVANAVAAEQCIFVTDVAGIMIGGKVADQVEKKEVEHYIEDGTIYGGMIPKVTSALSALDKGLSSVMIVSGKTPFFNGEEWKGTKIIGKE